MKRFIVIATVIAAFSIGLLGSCGMGGASVKSEKDSIAYAVGIDLGHFIKYRVDSTLNVKVVAKAIQDVLDDKMMMDAEVSQNFLQEVFMVRKPARALKEGEEFLAKVEKDNPSIIKTESGLMYEIIEAGDSEIIAASDDDEVEVVYEGRLKDGTVFDSSIERGDTAKFALSRVIPGWTEGIKLVGKGGKIKLWIPADIGYGAQGGGGGVIGPNEPLIFEVTVVDVHPAEADE